MAEKQNCKERILKHVGMAIVSVSLMTSPALAAAAPVDPAEAAAQQNYK